MSPPAAEYPPVPGAAAGRQGSRCAINVVENAGKEILLLKRAMHLRLGAGRWGFCAGHIETNETPRECSARELREEIGCRHRVHLLRAIGPVSDAFYGGSYEIHLFHYLWISGDIELGEEHTGFAWVTRERYRDYDVMDGIDEDLAWLEVWPHAFLNQGRIPAHLRR